MSEKEPKRPWEPWEKMSPQRQASVIADVEQGGFGSELRVRQILAEEGFCCRAYYFHDLDENKTRELDIFAKRRQRNFYRYEPMLQYHVLAEVKSGYTWILGDRIDPEPGFDRWKRALNAAPDWYKNNFWESCDGPDSCNEWDRLQEILAGEDLDAERWASSVFQYKGTDAWYEAAVKVAKAQHDLRRSCRYSLSVVVPIVILDGNMLAADLSSGSLELTTCDQAQIPFEYASRKYRAKMTPLHLLTMRALPEFLRKLKALESEAMQLIDTVYPQTEQGKSDNYWAPGDRYWLARGENDDTGEEGPDE